jgi:hypothetical protein
MKTKNIAKILQKKIMNLEIIWGLDGIGITSIIYHTLQSDGAQLTLGTEFWTLGSTTPLLPHPCILLEQYFYP